jgi:hypothetical protein
MCRQDSPVERQGHASVIVMDTLFIFGGSNESGLLSDIWMFDLERLKWTKLIVKGEKLIARTNHRAITLPGGIHLLFN